MVDEEVTSAANVADAPRRVRGEDLGHRYKVSARTGGEMLRKMIAAGVVKKLGAMIMGRWSAIDAWVAGGGEMPKARRRSSGVKS